MSISALRATRIQAYKLVGIPASVIVLISLFLLVLQGSNACYSALLGGIGWILPNIYFAHKVFSGTEVRGIKYILQRFYRAEVIKLCLVAIFFVTVVKIFSIVMWAFLLTFMAAQVTFWLAAFIVF